VPEKDLVRGAETASRRGLPQACTAEGKASRRRPSHAGSRSHDDLDSTKIRGLAGGRIYQGQECHPFGPCLWGKEAQLCRTALLGQRVLRLNGRSRRSRDTGVHQEAGARGQSPGANESMALIGHLQVAQQIGAASATPPAALSGSLLLGRVSDPKQPL